MGCEAASVGRGEGLDIGVCAAGLLIIGGGPHGFARWIATGWLACHITSGRSRDWFSMMELFRHHLW